MSRSDWYHDPSNKNATTRLPTTTYGLSSSSSAPRLRSPILPSSSFSSASLPIHNYHHQNSRTPSPRRRVGGDKWSLPNPLLPFSRSGPRHRRRLRISISGPIMLFRHGLLFKLFLLLIVVGATLTLLWSAWEPYLELQFHPRKWLRTEIHAVPPLSGCFDEGRVDAGYNVSERLYGRRRWEVQAGAGMKLERDCFAYAGTVGGVEGDGGWGVGEMNPSRGRRKPGVDGLYNVEEENVGKTIFHTYWRTDLAPFGPRQEHMLQSFFATQPVSRSHLILWSNGDLSQNEILQKYLRKYPSSFSLRTFNSRELAAGTALDGSPYLGTNWKDAKAWVDGDLVRLLVLWNEGGVWIDMDMLLTRSLSPLLEHEFVTQWDCYDKYIQPFNGALMHFHRHSPYLCEAFHTITTSPPPRASSTDWGALLYLKVFRRLIHSSIPPFKILPWCFADGVSCRKDNRLPDPFVGDVVEGAGRWNRGGSGEKEEDGEEAPKRMDADSRWDLREGKDLDWALSNVFALHLHNRWDKPFPKDGWVERLLLRRYWDRLRRVMGRSNDS